ncbi:MAG: flagellin [Dehalococcoidia bacterium]|jgi:flagellin FlaB
MLKKFLNREKGITGLETAIILIAFVVVAAVFAYTTLSAGLFSTQKSQEAVYSGLKEAQSTLELKGNVIATANGSGPGNYVQQISFTVSNVLGGEAIDFEPPDAASTATGVADNSSENKIVINYVDQSQTVNDLYWTIDKLGGADDDNLLENNEKFKITIGGGTAGSAPGNLIDALTGNELDVNTEFSLIIQTPVGAVLEIERTTPAYLDTIMNLH